MTIKKLQMYQQAGRHLPNSTCDFRHTNFSKPVRAQREEREKGVLVFGGNSFPARTAGLCVLPHSDCVKLRVRNEIHTRHTTTVHAKLSGLRQC